MTQTCLCVNVNVFTSCVPPTSVINTPKSPHIDRKSRYMFVQAAPNRLKLQLSARHLDPMYSLALILNRKTVQSFRGLPSLAFANFQKFKFEQFCNVAFFGIKCGDLSET